MKIEDYSFIPGTAERRITPHIVFRPLRSWHSLTYAGEGLTIVKGDRSGCLDDRGHSTKPYTVTHRLYWSEKNDQRISSFLSYPNAMGFCDTYFWEIYGSDRMEDCERFTTEDEMEQRVIELLSSDR